MPILLRFNIIRLRSGLHQSVEWLDLVSNSFSVSVCISLEWAMFAYSAFLADMGLCSTCPSLLLLCVVPWLPSGLCTLEVVEVGLVTFVSSGLCLVWMPVVLGCTTLWHGCWVPLLKWVLNCLALHVVLCYGVATCPMLSPKVSLVAQ